MLIGVPKEIKDQEFRVGMVPASVKELINNGHKVIVETKAGSGIGISDEDYRTAGAEIAADAKEVFAKAELIVKVKEPQMVECAMLREGQTLFTYLHLAPVPELAQALQKSKCTAIAYETVTDDRGGLPLLTPMSEVAGRMSIQAGASCLEKAKGGSGILLGGVPGVAPANVVVIGGGVVGTNAIRMAVGMEANVTVLDKSLNRLRQLDELFGACIKNIYATKDALEHSIQNADLVIGAVLVPGGAAPKMITRSLLKKMRPGSVIVDVSIDQGGFMETSRPTTHTQPTYVEEGVVHYCVSNMPGAVPRTATFALNNATLPFILSLANKGIATALRSDKHLMNGLNVYRGDITHPMVAESLGVKFIEVLL